MRETSIESEDKIDKIDVKVLGTQAVVDAEAPGLEKREDAMDPKWDQMGFHRANDVRIVVDARPGGIALPSVDLHRCCRADIHGDEGMQAVGGIVGNLGKANAIGFGYSRRHSKLSDQVLSYEQLNFW